MVYCVAHRSATRRRRAAGTARVGVVPPLARAVLERNAVPVAAVVYHDDMFVPADLSLATAARIRGLTPWVTNEYEHDGLRMDGARVFDRLQEDLRLFEPGR